MSAELNLNTRDANDARDVKVPAVQYCAVECLCGKRAGATLGHYGRVQCGCGVVWWALAPGLAPGRNGQGGYGPLKLFRWPGFAGFSPEQSAHFLHYKS